NVPVGLNKMLAFLVGVHHAASPLRRCHLRGSIAINSSISLRECTKLAASRSRSRRRVDPIAQAGYANGFGAMLAAEEGAVLLEPVADNADAAVLAGRRQAWIAHSKLSKVWVVPFMLT